MTKTSEIAEQEVVVELSLEDVVRAEVDAVVTTRLSPYRLAKVLSDLGDRAVKPQMMYNYSKAGLLKTVENALGHQEVTQYEASRFATAFLLRQRVAQAKIDAELAGA
jgi:hypothetical protein